MTKQEKNVRKPLGKPAINDGVDIFNTGLPEFSEDYIMSTLTDREKENIEFMHNKGKGLSKEIILENLMFRRLLNKFKVSQND